MMSGKRLVQKPILAATSSAVALAASQLGRPKRALVTNGDEPSSKALKLEHPPTETVGGSLYINAHNHDFLTHCFSQLAAVAASPARKRSAASAALSEPSSEKRAHAVRIASLKHEVKVKDEVSDDDSDSIHAADGKMAAAEVRALAVVMMCTGSADDAYTGAVHLSGGY